MPSAEGTAPGSTRREYRSPLRARRAAETRSALLDAARLLFTTSGWTGTGMRDVAAEAGVATETVYAYFPSKRALLEAVIDLAVVGDDQPIALGDRAEFAEIGRGTREERIAAAAQLVAGVHVRTAAFAKVLREAANTDQEIAGILESTRERQRRDVTAAVELIVGGEVGETDRDGVWALTSPEVYLLLVEVSGWTVDRYEAWMGEMLRRAVPRRAREGRASR
ncbi:MAG TPA: helix-turn-helix domain-containing protein [Ilumatobacteraceae bacterium]|nr:helix-turn-helix domain-containing protein [Ilumatobacteraceae bacterium]